MEKRITWIIRIIDFDKKAPGDMFNRDRSPQTGAPRTLARYALPDLMPSKSP